MPRICSVLHGLLLLLVFACPCHSQGQGFHYPVPPDAISDRQGRINYMAEHFWNKQTIADTALFQSPKLLLDYLYLLKQSDDTDRHVQSFVSMSCRQESTFGLILYWLDNILYDSSSPQYDEEFYTKLLDTVIASAADSVMKLIPKQRMEIINKNRVNQYANNFSFVDKAGKENNMYSINASLLLLIFNNPDCSLCHQTEESIAKNEELQDLIGKGTLMVLAITPDADYIDWLSHVYPSNWMVGYDKEKAVYSQRLYDIQRLPCIYLLDKDKRVLLKEADYDRLCKYLSK